MPRTNPIPVFEPNVEQSESGQKIQDIMSQEFTPDLDQLGEKVTLLLGAHLTGQIKLPKDSLSLCTILFRKLVPDAPKRIEVTARRDPAEYLAEALQSNPHSFSNLSQTARAAAQREAKLSQQLILYNKELGLEQETDSENPYPGETDHDADLPPVDYHPTGFDEDEIDSSSDTNTPN